MKDAPFTSDSSSSLPPCPSPSRCPYCPAGASPHWIRWGCYERYAGDPANPSRRINIPRYRCAVVGRTFSLLPDALMPYWGVRTGETLHRLRALFVSRLGVNTLARRTGAARGTLRHLKARFLRTVPKLRLPQREGALGAAAFLGALSDMKPADLAALLRGWKERRPKLSLVGIYVR